MSAPVLLAAGPMTIDPTATALERAASPDGAAPPVSVVSVLSDDPRRRCTARPRLPGVTGVTGPPAGD